MSIIDSKMTLTLTDKLIMTDRKLLSFVSGTTVYSFDIYANALTHTIILTMPTISGAVCTATLSIENSNGEEIYASASTLAEATVHVLSTEKPLIGKNTVKVTLSTDPLSSASCYVTMYLQG